MSVLPVSLHFRLGNGNALRAPIHFIVVMLFRSDRKKEISFQLADDHAFPTERLHLFETCFRQALYASSNAVHRFRAAILGFFLGSFSYEHKAAIEN